MNSSREFKRILGDRFRDVKENYRKVNTMLGDIVKVTPSSKMVGDMAIFMTQNGLTPENIVKKGANLAFPDSAVSYFSGMMGQPAWGFPKDLQKVVLKGKQAVACRPGELLEPVDFEAVKREMLEFDSDPSDRAVISYCLYPKVSGTINGIRRSTAASPALAATYFSTDCP